MGKSPAESSAPLPSAPRRGGAGFSIFGIPVTVMSSFWIISVLFGMSGATGAANAGSGIAHALLWTAIVFVSIMLHELGHAVTARAFGAKPAITLHAMGGLTHFEGGKMTRSQSWLISFAGPAAGLALGLLVYAVTYSRPMGHDMKDVVQSILWINIGWSLINLLPVVPFDGGHMMSAFLGPRHALLNALISATVGSAVAVAGFVYLGSPGFWIALLFGSATLGAVRQVRRIWHFGADHKAGFDAELLRARETVARGDAQEVLTIARNVAAGAQAPITRNGATLAMAWAQAALGRAVAARELLERLEPGVPVDPYLLAAVEDALGSPEGARARLETARLQGMKDPEAIKLLIDLYVRDDKFSLAVDVAAEELDVLGRDAGRTVLAEAMSRGAYDAAASLASRMFEVYGEPLDALAEARAAALSGKRDRALDVLERIANSAPREIGGLRYDAAFESLRGDERFEQLLRLVDRS
jgi:Zn-dependent protease